MKNKHFVLFFLATVALGVAFKKCDFDYLYKKNTIIFEQDSAKITSFSYILNDTDSLEILWHNMSNRWLVTQNLKTIEPREELVSELFSEIKNAQIGSVLTKNQADYDSFNIEKKKAVQLKIFKNDREFDAFFLSEFKKNDGQTGFAVRFSSADEVFELTNSKIVKLLKTPLNSLKNNELCQFDPEKIIAVSIDLDNDSLFLFDKTDGFWITPGGEEKLELTQFSRFFGQLQNIQRGLEFAENFGEFEKNNARVGQISLMSADAKGSFSLVGYRKNEQNFVIHSSQNPANFFELPDSIARQIFCNPTTNLDEKSDEKTTKKAAAKMRLNKK
jgi:hypothetical protein